MAFLQKARDMAAQATEGLNATAQDNAMGDKVKSGLATAGKKTRDVVGRIDPGILADAVIKATALQEKTNAKLREKRSIYRIGELVVTASIPPGISFTIVRVTDLEVETLGAEQLLTSADLVAKEEAKGETDGTLAVEGGEESVELALDERA